MLITNTEFADHVMLVHSANSQIEKKIDIYPSDANTHSRNIKLYDNLLPYDIRQGSVCSVKSLGRLGHWGDMRDDSAEILFQSFLQEALVSRQSNFQVKHGTSSVRKCTLFKQGALFRQKSTVHLLVRACFCFCFKCFLFNQTKRLSGFRFLRLT